MNKYFLFLFCLSAFYGNAQVNDAGVWTSINIEKKIAKGFTAGLSQEFRFNENVSELGTAFTEVSVEHKIIKRLSFGIGYRFIQSRNLDDSYSLRHRLLADLSYRYKIKKVGIALRERFQSQVKDIQYGEDGFAPVHYLRSKLNIKYAPEKKYAPWISAEVFYQLNNNKGNEIDNIRYTAGVDYDFNKRHSISLFYLINKEVNTSDPLTEYISGLSYKYSF
ncbi:MAG: DUF2490 domain-containing protein [Bacteroidota bacterium]